MTLEAIIERYRIPAETVRQMANDGVLVDTLLTPEQVAKRYLCSISSIYKAVQQGKLPARRLKGSRLVRFDLRDIEEAA